MYIQSDDIANGVKDLLEVQLTEVLSGNYKNNSLILLTALHQWCIFFLQCFECLIQPNLNFFVWYTDFGEFCYIE